MAQRRDLIGRLADAGEEAIQRLGEAPGANRLVEVATSLRDRVDELQKKVRGLDELERRLTALEKKVAALEKPKPARKRPTSSARKPAARKSASS